MKPRSYTPTEFHPTSPRSGNDGSKVYRMQNMILRGSMSEPYAEVYNGSLNLGEDIATSVITGTVATSVTTKIITGTGTLFKTELHLGQALEIYGGAPETRIPVRVDEIISDTQFTVFRTPHAAISGASCVRLPVMFPLNKKRGTQIWGSGVETDLGTIIDVGDGTLRRNGVALPGVSLAAARTPKIAVFDSTTGNYTVFTLGMATPATLAAAAVAGTGKNMPAGLYSVREVPARIATRGYNNPGPKAEVTLTLGQAIQVTVGAADTANGQDARMFFVTLTTGGRGGPWYRYEFPMLIPVGVGAGEIPAAGGTYVIEYNDAEISGADLLQFNNDAPGHAEFVAYMSGIPIWISCNGPGNTSPGPFIRPAKPRNIEAAPSAQAVSASPPDTIVGYMLGNRGRMYLMCVNTLQIAIPTQSTDPRIPAFAVRPYWSSGFPNPETLVLIGDTLVGMTNNGLARSISEGDVGSEEYNFAVAMEELLRDITPGHCLIKLDPKNNAMVLFHSGHSINASGFWTTRAWMYGLRENRWIGDILLTSTSGDMIVSGAATVNGQLEFLCGGRQSAGTTVVRTYRWDTLDPGGVVIPWFIAWDFSDYGVEDRTKVVKGVRFIGHITAATQLDGVSVHGAGPGELISAANLEADPVGKSGVIIPSAFAGIGESDFVELDVDNLSQLTVRVCGVWDGQATKDRIDEIVTLVGVRGARR